VFRGGGTYDLSLYEFLSALPSSAARCCRRMRWIAGLVYLHQRLSLTQWCRRR
jgi:hypothetical protein